VLLIKCADFARDNVMPLDQLLEQAGNKINNSLTLFFLIIAVYKGYADISFAKCTLEIVDN
jgi:hypothetical protein